MSESLILFDYDGVLVDSLPHNLAVVKEVCEAMGYQVFPDVEYCRSAKCISFETWARHIKMMESEIPLFLDRVLLALSEVAKTLNTFSGIPDVMKQLSESNKLGVITSNSSVAVKEFAKHHGLHEAFLDYIGADQPGSKSEKIKLLVNKYKVSLDNVYYVGDAGSDVEQGREAGVKTIAVTWGFQGRARLLEAEPDFIIDSPEELLQIVNPMLKF